MQRNSSRSSEKVNAKNREAVSFKPQGRSEILTKRTPYGILLFSADHHLVYLNKEAHTLLSSEKLKENKSHNGSGSASSIPKEIDHLCDQLRLMVSTSRPEKLYFGDSPNPSLMILPSVGQKGSALRAIWLEGPQSDLAWSGYILVLIEPVAT